VQLSLHSCVLETDLVSCIHDIPAAIILVQNEMLLNSISIARWDKSPSTILYLMFQGWDITPFVGECFVAFSSIHHPHRMAL
jgi:hypothetical protein